MTGIVQGLLAAYSAVSGAVSDAYFNLVTLLLPGNGTNGAQNNTFLDSSTNNFTITRNGNTTQGTFSPFSQTGWSNFFNGSSSLSLATATAIGTGNVTVEFWFYPTDTSATYYGIYDGRSSNNTDTGLGIFQYGRTIEIYGLGLKVSSAANAFTANTWTHFAVVRTSGTCQIYINGVASGSSASYSNNFTSTIRSIGGGVSAAFYYPGYISNLREVTSALYSGNFTPSTTPLTAVSGTTLLTCQSNRFIDNSSNAYAITVAAGSPSVQAFSPFLPTAAYSAATVGGSGYFDGTGDYLSFASNAAFTVGTGDLTIEAWIYVTSLSQIYQGILSGRADTPSNFPGLGLVIDNSQLFFSILNVGSGLRDSATVPLNQWVHVVGVRSGTNAALFVNGARKASSTNSENGTSSAMVVGRYYPATDNYYFSGYISGARLVKGTAVYDPTQTSITVPTAPLTAITNTSLLCNFTNAGITDATAKNDLETVGNAQISTTQSKFGGSSMYFDGTGDYLRVPYSKQWALGGDFTIEFWINYSAHGNYGGIVSCANSNTGSPPSAGWAVVFYATTNNLYFEGQGGFNIQSSSSISTNTWTHCAVVRSGSTITMYIGGTSVGSGTSSTVFDSTSDPLLIGIERGFSGTMTGYIDDLRISRYARYTSAFTPPTAAFPLQ